MPRSAATSPRRSAWARATAARASATRRASPHPFPRLSVMTLECRIATPADMPQIAHLRWHLRVDDVPVSDQSAYEQFVTDFLHICAAEWQPAEIAHWIALE